jgi:hypothetical protein
MLAMTLWTIMLRRQGQQKRHQARAQANRDLPQVGDTIKVVDDDGTKVLAIIVGSPHYHPPRATALGRYTINADEVTQL